MDRKEEKEIQRRISGDRVRTNLLKGVENKALVFLVSRIPSWISSDMLTFIGIIGSLLIMISFIMAHEIDRIYLLVGIAGFIVNWFGDSLDGRLAFYRQKIRKWYGFSLDITTDWIGTILIGIGYIIYVDSTWEILGYFFVVLYGWAMIITLLKYKITGHYSIDSGKFGPTEVRILISAVLIIEILLPDTIMFSAGISCIMLLFINVMESIKMLRLADNLDQVEKKNKIKNNSLL